MLFIILFFFFFLSYTGLFLSPYNVIGTFIVGRDVPGSFNLHVHLRHGPPSSCEPGRLRTTVLAEPDSALIGGKKKSSTAADRLSTIGKGDGEGALVLCEQQIL